MDLKTLLPHLRNDEISSDIDFFLSGKPTKIFQAHKLIVSRNSPFFRNEFYSKGYLQNEESNVTENENENENVNVNDHGGSREKYFIWGISAQTFSLLLDFCYCVPIELTLLNAPHLLVASHHFEILSLKQQCLKYLLPVITQETCLLIYDRLSSALSKLQLPNKTKTKTKTTKEKEKKIQIKNNKIRIQTKQTQVASGDVKFKKKPNCHPLLQKITKYLQTYLHDALEIENCLNIVSERSIIFFIELLSFLDPQICTNPKNSIEIITFRRLYERAKYLTAKDKGNSEDPQHLRRSISSLLEHFKSHVYQLPNKGFSNIQTNDLLEIAETGLIPYCDLFNLYLKCPLVPRSKLNPIKSTRGISKLNLPQKHQHNLWNNFDKNFHEMFHDVKKNNKNYYIQNWKGSHPKRRRLITSRVHGTDSNKHQSSLHENELMENGNGLGFGVNNFNNGFNNSVNNSNNNNNNNNNNINHDQTNVFKNQIAVNGYNSIPLGDFNSSKNPLDQVGNNYHGAKEITNNPIHEENLRSTSEGRKNQSFNENFSSLFQQNPVTEPKISRDGTQLSFTPKSNLQNFWLGSKNDITETNEKEQKQLKIDKSLINEKIKVLLLTTQKNEEHSENVKGILKLDPLIGVVDYFNCIHNILTIESLKNYDVIFLYSNSSLLDSRAIQKILLKFVKMGKGLVICSVFALVKNPNDVKNNKPKRSWLSLLQIRRGKLVDFEKNSNFEKNQQIQMGNETDTSLSTTNLAESHSSSSSSSSSSFLDSDDDLDLNSSLNTNMDKESINNSEHSKDDKNIIYNNDLNLSNAIDKNNIGKSKEKEQEEGIEMESNISQINNSNNNDDHIDNKNQNINKNNDGNDKDEFFKDNGNEKNNQNYIELETVNQETDLQKKNNTNSVQKFSKQNIFVKKKNTNPTQQKNKKKKKKKKKKRVLNDYKVLCEWNDGLPLIILPRRKKNWGKVVILNLYPVSDSVTEQDGYRWDPSTDGDKILANSVKYVSNLSTK
ncbi:hypothetical protein M0813_17607 [Anaeramoeba flamelloides]|uniref:BTB domain-containing protein n=1 Tax=Anaeramoeba flamelloides TaxID=1746091 RepID=A0ABQ8YV38_9EUKA|nr:hypothetical protein M0813_17607 [Anaeramoeba flamelloides]